MKLHANILKPRFDIVLSALSTIKDLGIAEWTEPKGGYFVSVDLMDGCAKRTVQLLKDAGVKMTPAGATFPYGIDPRDRNIRICSDLSSGRGVESRYGYVLSLRKDLLR